VLFVTIPDIARLFYEIFWRDCVCLDNKCPLQSYSEQKRVIQYVPSHVILSYELCYSKR
jgi:hypothetical protein